MHFAKPFLAATLALTLAMPAWAQAQPAPPEAPDAAAMQVVAACLADAGIAMPEATPAKPGDQTAAGKPPAPPATQGSAGQPPAPPQDGHGQPPEGEQLTAEQQQVVDDCFAQAGISRPPAPQEQAPPATVG
jgi:hypothetical protein